MRDTLVWLIVATFVAVGLLDLTHSRIQSGAACILLAVVNALFLL